MSAQSDYGAKLSKLLAELAIEGSREGLPGALAALATATQMLARSGGVSDKNMSEMFSMLANSNPRKLDA